MKYSIAELDALKKEFPEDAVLQQRADELKRSIEKHGPLLDPSAYSGNISIIAIRKSEAQRQKNLSEEVHGIVERLSRSSEFQMIKSAEAAEERHRAWQKDAEVRSFELQRQNTRIQWILSAVSALSITTALISTYYNHISINLLREQVAIENESLSVQKDQMKSDGDILDLKKRIDSLESNTPKKR